MGMQTSHNVIYHVYGRWEHKVLERIRPCSGKVLLFASHGSVGFFFFFLIRLKTKKLNLNKKTKYDIINKKQNLNLNY
jgi:hypothetical protein